MAEMAGEIPPDMVRVGGSPVYKIGRRLGSGGYGQVWAGRRVDKLSGRAVVRGPRKVAVKFERKGSKGCRKGPPHEWEVYDDLGDIDVVPKVYFKGQQGDFYLMIMDELGPSLWDEWISSFQAMKSERVCGIAAESISILEKVHLKGYVHGDVKPSNFVLGQPRTLQEKKLYLVDLGLATRWRDSASGKHVEYNQRPYVFRGTTSYSSVHAHLGRVASRRDDLESLLYTLIFLHQGKLPWDTYQGGNISFLVCKNKMAISPDTLCLSCPSSFRRFRDIVVNMEFDEEPNYQKLISLFEDSMGSIPAVTPINTDGAQNVICQVGQKRDRFTSEEGNNDRPHKRNRFGGPARLWISVFDGRERWHQRYTSVDDSLLAPYIKEGRLDGLFISCVASQTNRWVVVMDPGMGFTSQVYQQTSEFFPKAWINEKWVNDYFITSVAGRANGSSFVVMSKGTKYELQSYKICDSFPIKWIRKKWKKGFHVTAMATAGSKWGVVMSFKAGFTDQVVELDFVFPSEGVCLRYNAGYRITSAAANSDQVALILSLLCQKRSGDGDDNDAHQVLTTCNFPMASAQANVRRNLFITSLCCRLGGS